MNKYNTLIAPTPAHAEACAYLLGGTQDRKYRTVVRLLNAMEGAQVREALGVLWRGARLDDREVE